MKKKTITKEKKESKEVQPNFSITLKINDQVYKGEGSTALEALQSIEKPAKMMGKGVFFMTDGEKSTKEVLMYPLRLRRLFYGKTAQVIQIKSLCMGMK